MNKLGVFLIVFVLLAVSAVWAGGSSAAASGSSATGKPPHVELIITQWGDEPEAMSSVLAEFEKRTADTLNTSIKMLWTPQADYQNKLRLMLSAGEQIDSCFDAAWILLQDFASRGVYAMLDSYFNNPAYPGLLNFDEDLLKNNMYVSDVGKHIYAIPFMQAPGAAVNGYMIRKDLREKYGLPPINTLSDLEHFMDMVLQNESGMLPLAANSNGGHMQELFTQYTTMMNNPDSLLWQVPVASGMFGVAELSSDRKSVINFYMIGDPRLVNGEWFSQGQFTKAREWYVKGYVDKDIMSRTPADMQNAFTSGRAAVLREGTPNYAVREAALKRAVPGAEVEFWAHQEKVRNLEPHVMRTNFLAANYQCIPVTSRNIDRTMAFYNWIFTNQENHDLLEYGIQGVHWNPVGNDKYSVPQGAPAYTFNGYKLTWNRNYVRFPADTNPDVLKYMQYTQKIENYYPEVFVGFTPYTDDIRTEIARILPIHQEAQNTSVTGVNENPRASLDDYHAKMMESGMQKICDEMIKQLNVFLAGKQ